MTVEFAPDTGHLRLSRTDFDRLVTLAGNDALHRAGVLTAGTPHPAIAADLRAVADAHCHLTLDLVDERGRKHGDGWIADHGAVLLFDTTDGVCEFVGLPVALIPAAVARLVGLQPRRQVDDAPHHLSRERYAALLPGQPVRIDENWGGLAAALSSGRWRHWSVTRSTRTGEATDLRVLDTEVGWYLCTTSVSEVVITPTDATTIWRLLTRLPSDDDAAHNG